MDAVFWGIGGVWVCGIALLFALMSVARRADDANDQLKFDADTAPLPYRIAGEALPVLASPASYSRFEIVSVP